MKKDLEKWKFGVNKCPLLIFKVLNGLYYMYAILSLINRGKTFARSHVTMTSVAMSICLLSNT